MNTTRALIAVLLLASSASAQSTIDKTWATNCASCHGKKGEGVEGQAKSLHSVDWIDGQHDRRLFETARNGTKDLKGHAFGGEGEGKISDQDLWGAIVFLREQSARAKPLPAPKAVGGLYKTKLHDYTIEPVIEKGITTPWSVDWLPDGTMLVTERGGTLRTWKDGQLSEPIKGTPKSIEMGQGGLMDVAVHPDYAKTGNGWVYLAYNRPGPDGKKAMTAIARGRIKDGAWTDEQILFKAKDEHVSTSGVHFGSRIVFTQPDANGKRFMFFSIGERGSADNAQSLKRPNGKVHRLFDDGSVPTDNPFVDTQDAYASIWSYGHRNPQGLAFDLDNRLWDTEHAPRGGDEVNLIAKGANYGWPIVTFGIQYSGQSNTFPWPEDKEKITLPKFYWLPSIGACGLDVYRAEKGFGAWKGDLIAGGLSGASVDRIRMKDGAFVERELILRGMGRVRDVVCGPDGSIYIVLNGPDKVVRMKPAPKSAETPRAN